MARDASLERAELLCSEENYAEESPRGASSGLESGVLLIEEVIGEGNLSEISWFELLYMCA